LFVIPASEPESRLPAGRQGVNRTNYKLSENAFKYNTCFNLCYNIFVFTAHLWIAGQARNDNGEL
jgi:hypothetical protein